ncbi:MAG: cell wall-binding repeat-containing protein [Actinobacteria bacterium]|nr:cell wall-binding repeat-containing protein [Actinomycetota bacterium]
MVHHARSGQSARQRPITYALGALLGMALLLGLAPPASDAAPPRSSFPGVTGTVVDWSGDGLVRSERYRGSTRFDTASLIAREGFDPSDAVLIARGDAFPDSLAGNYLAGQLGAPVLLTHTTFVPDETRAAIEDLGASHAFILGGPEAVSEAVADQLRALGLNVGRITGAHRYATAAAIATGPGTTVGFLNGRRTAIVASGENFPDALVAGAVAFSAEFPLLLTRSGSLHPDTAEALESRAITQVIIPGGPVAVSETVAAQLRARGITVIRVSGEDRVETAVAIARFARDQLGWGTEVLNFAVGANFPDALSLGARAGLLRSPVLLTWDPETLDSRAAALAPFLESLGCEVELVRVAGGPAAVRVAAEFQLRRLATEDGACDLTLDPSEATNPAATDHSVTATVAGHAVDRLPDVPVRFEVYRSTDGGDDFGAVPVVTDTVTTDDDGEATLDYDGPATAAVDRIVACVDDTADGCATVTAGNVVTDPDDVADTADATWEAGAPDTLVLEPESATNTVGEDHTVTATLTDSSGNPVSGADVRFEVTGAGDPTPASGTDTTDANGTATFTFTNQQSGTNTITACTDDDGTEPDTCAAATGPGVSWPRAQWRCCWWWQPWSCSSSPGRPPDLSSEMARSSRRRTRQNPDRPRRTLPGRSPPRS